MVGLSTIANDIITGADTHVTRGGPMHPSVFSITVCERASSKGISFEFDSKRHKTVTKTRNVLGVRSSQREPLLAFHFLTPVNHTRTRTVPLDSSNLKVVLAQGQSRALGIARDGVEGLAGCTNDHRVENIGATAEDPEFD